MVRALTSAVATVNVKKLPRTIPQMRPLREDLVVGVPENKCLASEIQVKALIRRLLTTDYGERQRDTGYYLRWSAARDSRKFVVNESVCLSLWRSGRRVLHSIAEAACHD
jgi:hypothetical protein